MSTFDQHCCDSLLRFGRRFEEVHRWLDEFPGNREISHAAPPGPPPRSRDPGSEGFFLVFCEVFQRQSPIDRGVTKP